MSEPEPGIGVGARPLSILGVRIDRVDFDQTLRLIQTWVEDEPGAENRSVHQICTVNPEFVIEARRNPAFALALERADLCVPDGMGILWAAQILGSPLRERVTGSDGLYLICERAAERGWSVYLLGAAEGVAEKAAAELKRLYPDLRVAGTYSGSPADEDWEAISTRLEQSRPDIVFVAYGHPAQDLWIDRYRGGIGARVAIGVGGALDFVAGERRRAPRWMQRFGLEWLFRLFQEPRRWRRMLALPIFALLILRERFNRHQ